MCALLKESRNELTACQIHSRKIRSTKALSTFPLINFAYIMLLFIVHCSEGWQRCYRSWMFKWIVMTCSWQCLQFGSMPPSSTWLGSEWIGLPGGLSTPVTVKHKHFQYGTHQAPVQKKKESYKSSNSDCCCCCCCCSYDDVFFIAGH